jgi:precorrin-6B methylase 2
MTAGLMNPDSLILAQVRDAICRQRAALIGEHLWQQTGRRVLTGPFAGMLLPEQHSWGSGDKAPKMLGCYEEELHDALEKAIQREPKLVVNVGCAEGYYAVGLGRRIPNVRVVAFDLHDAARRVCEESARENAVTALEVRDACTPEGLVALCARQRTLVVMDCEGGELSLISPATVAGLRQADVIVECHDFANPSTTAAVHEALSRYHDVECVIEGARNPNRYEALRQLPSADRWLAVCEFRPSTMHWLVAWSKD